jgi:hypothetical protein
MAVDDKIKQKVIAEWKVGSSQNSLANKYRLSKATVNKWCRDVHQENVNIVNAQVNVIRALSEKSEQEANAIMNAVNDLTAFERKSNERMQKIEDYALSLLSSCEKPTEVKAVMDITVKHREARLGKQPDTAIQINNNESQTPSRIRIVAPKLIPNHDD